MSPFARFRRPQPVLTLALLVAVLVRALIPAGFMPSGERPFSLQICPDGLPATVVAGLQAGHGERAHHSAVATATGSAEHHHGAIHPTHGGHESDQHHGASALEECTFGAASAGAMLVGQWTQPLQPSPDAYLTITQSSSPAPVQARRFPQRQPRAPPVFS